MTNILIQSHAEAIAAALGNGWTRSNKFDESDSSWRALIVHPDGRELFLSTTWAGKGRLYIGGSLPDGTTLPYKAELPSITVSENKSAQQVAQDIERRLLPAYTTLAATCLQNKANADAYEARKKDLQAQVAVIVNGRIKDDNVYTGGWDLKVTSPESIQLNHVYITLEQIRKINEVCPELFKKSDSEGL